MQLDTIDELYEYINTYSCNSEIKHWNVCNFLSRYLSRLLKLDTPKIHNINGDIAILNFFIGNSYLTDLNISIPENFNIFGPFTYGMLKDIGNNQNCIGCINCTNCSNCQGCIDCHDCANCEYCNGSSMCVKTIGCNNCIDCNDCQCCTNCTNCKRCFVCNDSNDLDLQCSCLNNIRQF